MVDLDVCMSCLLIMFRADHVLSIIRRLRPDHVLCTLGLWGPGERPGLASVLGSSVPASECQCLDVWGLELRWACLRNSLSSECGDLVLPRVSAMVGALVLIPARFTFPGAHGESSGGLPGNNSNLPARAWCIGKQV